MKRNMETVRRIALATAALPWGKKLTELPDVDKAEFSAHVIWMIEAGLITGRVNTGSANAWVDRLTWDGCEFADAVQNDTLWRKAQDNVLKPSASFTFGLLKDWLAQEIRNGLPTLGRCASKSAMQPPPLLELVHCQRL